MRLARSNRFDVVKSLWTKTRGGLAILAMRQLLRGFFKNAWLISDILREIEAFVKISILFEGIFREIEAFSNTFLVESRLFLNDVRFFQ
jgi:hypothetical protein